MSDGMEMLPWWVLVTVLSVGCAAAAVYTVTIGMW